jgi:hypothetical protein
MTARRTLIMLLFLVASVSSGVILAVATWVLPRVGVPTGPWTLPGAVLAGYLPLFFAARAHVLPPHLARPAWRALVMLILWVAAAFAIWQATLAVVRPILRAVGFERGTFVILLGSLFVGLWVIEALVRPTRLSR